MANFVSNSFPLCCGAQILTNLPSYFTGDKEEFKKAWVTRIKQAVTTHGISLIIIDDENDYKEFSPMLEEAGFRLVVSSLTKPYGNEKIYLFAFELRKVNTPL